MGCANVLSFKRRNSSKLVELGIVRYAPPTFSKMVRAMYLKGGGGSTSTKMSLALEIARLSALSVRGCVSNRMNGIERVCGK